MGKYWLISSIAVFFTLGCTNAPDLKSECVRRCTDPCPGFEPITDEARCETTCDSWYAGIEETRTQATTAGCSSQVAESESCFADHWCTSGTDCSAENEAVTACFATFCTENPDHELCAD